MSCEHIGKEEKNRYILGFGEMTHENLTLCLNMRAIGREIRVICLECLCTVVHILYTCTNRIHASQLDLTLVFLRVVKICEK